MLSLPASVRVFVCLDAVDMRRSFDGLAALAEQVLEQDPFSGHLFVFGSRRGDRMKILYWDKDGYALWCKRLECGTFKFHRGDGRGSEISRADLGLILEGIDIAQAKRSKRFALQRT
jgi:transposase